MQNRSESESMGIRSKSLGHDERFHNQRFRSYRQLSNRRIQVDDVVLDVGCGEGDLFKFLDKGRKVGLDKSRKFLLEARKRSVDSGFVQGLADVLPFSDNTFDWVFCTEVIEHLARPEQCLREVRRVLKPGGRFVVSTYNHYNIFNLVTGRAFSKKPRFPEIHVREYNWFSFLAFLKKYFSVVKRTQAGSSTWLEIFLKTSHLPIGDFMIVLAKNK